ncbi:hypothetical protein EJB05_11920, partial [Eragrostis curvula]
MTMKVTIPILVSVFAFNVFTTYQSCGEQDCHEEKELVMAKCIATITNHGPYAPPNLPCRQAVAASDMVCICRTLSHLDETSVSASKLVHLAKDCGKPVPVGSKCGSWTIPPPLSSPSQRNMHKLSCIA